METFTLVGEDSNKIPMENYMKNHFSFLGVKSIERRKQSKDLIKESKLLSQVELYQLINMLYEKNEREYQYVAIDLCVANVGKMNWQDLKKYAPLIEEKAWWDSVDAWRKVFGLFIKLQPECKETVFDYFYKHPNFWMRRVAINLQLMEKEKTDLMLLTKAIEYDNSTDEFFIQKAIGWSLRQYSKVDSDWVITYTNESNLTPFAKKEALKLIRKADE